MLYSQKYTPLHCFFAILPAGKQKENNSKNNFISLHKENRESGSNSGRL